MGGQLSNRNAVDNAKLELANAKQRSMESAKPERLRISDYPSINPVALFNQCARKCGTIPFGGGDSDEWHRQELLRIIYCAKEHGRGNSDILLRFAPFAGAMGYLMRR